jgi:hypothetical protein
MMANYLNECQTAGENPSWSWDEKTQVRAINAYYKSRKNPARMQKIQRAKQFQKQGFWETVHVIESQPHVPFRAVSAR